MSESKNALTGLLKKQVFYQFQQTQKIKQKIDENNQYFKNAKIVDGKKYFYKDGKLEKTAIVREGKVIRYETSKEQKN